ncbi:MAG: SurA N-terminal domain-containing protein [Undibacterium sp.]|nr:SurA N-terminal domain-containing protein [Undibacterium sp.]
MFDYIRTHKRIMQLLLLILIFPAFALFGVDSFMRSSNANGAVATVGNLKVSKQEFDQALRSQLDRLKQAYGQDFDAQVLNTPEARKGILDDLVARKAMTLETTKSNLTVTDEVLQKNLRSLEELKKPDGSFDRDRYMSLLAMQGKTALMYDAEQRQDLTMQQLVGAIQNTAFTPKAVSERIALISEQERDIAAFNFKAKDYVAEVKLTDAKLRDYYNKNAKKFEIPEMLSAEYVVLSADSLAEQIVVSDAELAGYYDQNKGKYSTKEQRRASHILLNLKKDASEAEAKAVKAKVENLLAQVRKDPSQFAKLAKENSQDLGSAEKGGDLDFFASDVMAKPFSDTTFKLKEGEISDPVQTEYGLHIIQLTAIKAQTIKPLEEVKAELVAEIKKQKASKAYAEAVETFTNTAYEQSDSLKPVADKLKLKIEKVANIGRNPNPMLPATVISNNPKFLKAIFAEDALKKKHNTEATEVAASTLVAGRVVEYKPASKRTFEEVKAVIEAQLTLTESAMLAKKAGEAKIQALKLADATDGFSEVKTVSRLKKADLSNDAFLAIAKADTQKLPTFVGVEVPGQGYDVYRISKVSAGTPDLARRATESKQVENSIAQQELYSYVEALKTKAKVVVNQAALQIKSGVDTGP